MERTVPSTFEIHFEPNIEQLNPAISKARARIFYKYANRNGGWITDEFAAKLANSIAYTPVVGIFDEEAQDFTSHDRNRSHAKIYGLVPANPNGEFAPHLDTDGVTRMYYTCDVYLYTGRYVEANRIIGNPQSLEFDINSMTGEWTMMEGELYYVYSNAEFIGLSVLGTYVEPAFEGAEFFKLLTEATEKGEITLTAEMAGRLLDFVNSANFNLNKNTNDEGGNASMDLATFKFSADDRTEALWRTVNPNFTQEGEWAFEKAVMQVTDDSVVMYDIATNEYTIAKYSVEEDKYTVEEPQAYHAVFMNEEDHTEYAALMEEFGDFARIKVSLKSGAEARAQNISGGINSTLITMSLEEKSELDEKITNFEAKIVELETSVSTYQTEATARDEELQQMTAAYEALKGAQDEVELANKNQLFIDYEKIVPAEKIEALKEKVSDFSLEDLEKELLFAAKTAAPDVFAKATNIPVAPAAFAHDEPAENGIVAILKETKEKRTIGG